MPSQFVCLIINGLNVNILSGDISSPDFSNPILRVAGQASYIQTVKTYSLLVNDNTRDLQMLTNKLDFLFLIITLCSVAMAVVWAANSCLIKTEVCSDEILQNKTTRKLRKRKVQLDDCHSISASTTLESSPRQSAEAEISQQVKMEALRQLIRSIDTEIRDLKVYSKFAEAQRYSIKESCDKKIEKLEKDFERNQICVDSTEANI